MAEHVRPVRSITSLERLEELQVKLEALVEEIYEDETLRAFSKEYQLTDAVRSLRLHFRSISSAEECLRDVIRYHPDGDCPR